MLFFFGSNSRKILKNNKSRRGLWPVIGQFVGQWLTCLCSCNQWRRWWWGGGLRSVSQRPGSQTCVSLWCCVCVKSDGGFFNQRCSSTLCCVSFHISYYAALCQPVMLCLISKRYLQNKGFLLLLFFFFFFLFFCFFVADFQFLPTTGIKSAKQEQKHLTHSSCSGWRFFRNPSKFLILTSSLWETTSLTSTGISRCFRFWFVF